MPLFVCLSCFVLFALCASSEFFQVSEVNKDDVIHASPKDIESIFQVSMSESGDDKKILLAATSKEKTEWMSYLKSLQKKAEEKDGVVSISLFCCVVSSNNVDNNRNSTLNLWCALEMFRSYLRMSSAARGGSPERERRCTSSAQRMGFMPARREGSRS